MRCKLSIFPTIFDDFFDFLAGCSIRAFRRLLRIYLEEYSKPMSDWVLLPQMRSLVPLPQPDDDEGLDDNDCNASPDDDKDEISSVSSIFNMTSASECTQSVGSFSTQQSFDPDVMFLMQLLPDVKKLDQNAKSIFKMQIQSLVHELKYGEA